MWGLTNLGWVSQGQAVTMGGGTVCHPWFPSSLRVRAVPLLLQPPQPCPLMGTLPRNARLFQPYSRLH